MLELGVELKIVLVLFFYNRSHTHTGDIICAYNMGDEGASMASRNRGLIKLIQIPSVTTLHTYQMCDGEYIIQFTLYILEGR